MSPRGLAKIAQLESYGRCSHALEPLNSPPCFDLVSFRVRRYDTLSVQLCHCLTPFGVSDLTADRVKYLHKLHLNS